MKDHMVIMNFTDIYKAQDSGGTKILHGRADSAHRLQLLL